MDVFRRFLLCLVFLIAACGGKDVPDQEHVENPHTEEPEPEEPEEPEVPPVCGRYEVLSGQECVPVEVRGVEEQAFSFTRAGYTMHGTLTLPVAQEGYRPPLFVLGHGSGPVDRDSTSDGHLGIGYGQLVRPFASLASALAQSGAAVYRFDKRGCFRENSDKRCPMRAADYPGDLADILVDDAIADLVEAIRTVGALPTVDGDDITIVGQSESGNYVPKLVGKEPGVVAGVMLAAPSLRVDVMLVAQHRDYADSLEARNPMAKKEVAAIRAEADALERGLAQILAGTYLQEHFFGAEVAYWLNWIELTDRLEEEFLSVEEPLLLLNGELDMNVMPTHLDRFASWAEAAGKTNAQFLRLPNVTHGFVTFANRKIDPNFSPAAVEAIVEWHRRQGAR